MFIPDLKIWLHHTSFLWDYRSELMQYLRHPAKTPEYREGRTHLDFLVPLKGEVVAWCERLVTCTIARW